MKSLEELICTYELMRYEKGSLADEALHYLKEYCDYKDTMEALPDYYEWLKAVDNPPLAWMDLIVGQSYWFVSNAVPKGIVKRHGKVKTQSKTGMTVIDDNGKGFLCEPCYQNRFWWAYRKEPENEE